MCLAFASAGFCRAACPRGDAGEEPAPAPEGVQASPGAAFGEADGD